MRTSYIATTSEASALHRGEQTAIIVKMKVQPYIDALNHAKIGNVNYGKTTDDKPAWDNLAKCVSPYALNEPVYVRETFVMFHGCVIYEAEGRYNHIVDGDLYTWRSPATMPRSAARTFFKPVSCEVVMVRDMQEEQILALGGWEYKKLPYHKSPILSLQHNIVTPKLSQSAWDNNDYIFYYKIEKI